MFTPVLILDVKMLRRKAFYICLLSIVLSP